jgi:hypothetical protein
MNTPTVRAKFICNSKFESEHKSVLVSFNPVGPQWNPVTKTCDFAADSGDNKKFWESSPSGELRLWIKNLPAAERFTVGQEYYLDFTPAEKIL